MEIEDNEQEILLEQENVSVGGGAVNSVNGQVGDVVLTTSDLENTSDYQTGSEVESAISTAVGAEATAREQADTRLDTAISGLTDALATETTARVTADTNLQRQIDGITASSDVTDIVGTYAQLQAYDTSTLGDNDIIKVLQDESRNDETTYYRWSTATQSFTLIGEEGPYYTKSQTDTLLADKQNTLTAGDGINISNDEISGVDFVGTDGTAAGEAGLVPAPATTDAGKFLKADGTWDTAGGSSVNVVQTTGRSKTDVMSQDATSSMVFADPATQVNIKIGGGSSVTNPSGCVTIGERASGGRDAVTIGSQTTGGVSGSVTIGHSAYGTSNSVAIGYSASSGNRSESVAIGHSASTGSAHPGSVALGSYAKCTRAGEVNIGSTDTSYGYDSTSYRILGGVHDPVDDHDAANKTYVDTAVAGAGGGPTVVQTTGTSTTNVMSQNAVTSMVFQDPATQHKVQVGGGVAGNVQYGTAIGFRAQATGEHSIAIGCGENDYESARAQARGSIAIGAGSFSKTQGVISVAANSHTEYGYNNTAYRLLSGLHDPVGDHDAATKGYVDTAVAGAGGGGAVALTTADYNYPTSNPTGVALWLLDPGVYYRENSDVVVYCSANGVSQTSERLSDTYTTAIVGAPSSNGYKQAILIGGSYSGITGSGKQNITRSYFLSSTGTANPSTNLIGDANIVDSLSSNYTKQPLSAKQGKVLNDKITALEARVAALEGN